MDRVNLNIAITFIWSNSMYSYQKPLKIVEKIRALFGAYQIQISYELIIAIIVIIIYRN